MNVQVVNRIGYWSSILSLIFGLGYCVAQILSTAGILPHPKDLFWLFLPSLFLAPAFLVTMICLNHLVQESQKIWTEIACAFAVAYCLCATIVYFTQLTVVLPHQLSGEWDENQVLIFDRRTFLMAVDCLGYFFMSLSTFFASFAFRSKESKWLFRWQFSNGSLMPILILAYFYPIFYYACAVWMITFPMAMIEAAKYFKNKPSQRLKPSRDSSRQLLEN